MAKSLIRRRIRSARDAEVREFCSVPAIIFRKSLFRKFPDSAQRIFSMKKLQKIHY